MSENQRGWMVAAVVVAIILAVAALAVSVFGSGGPSFGDEMSAQGVRWGRIDNLRVDHHLRVDEDAVISGPTALPTGTPALVVDNAGVGRAFEVRDAGTPVFAVNDGGSVSQTGDQALTGDVSITGELQVAQATAAATATPAVIINSSAAGSKLLEVRDASTPVFSILNGGAVSRTGNDTMTGDLAVTGAGRVAAATAVATATPAFVVDSLGVSNLFEVRDAATPVFAVNNGGTVVGNVLQYGSSGERAVASTESITGTATVAHGLTTVTWALCTLGEDPTSGAGDAAHVTVSVSGNTVTAKVWQDDFVTAAEETDVDVHCLVIGTP